MTWEAVATTYTVYVFPADDPWRQVYNDLDTFYISVESRGDDRWAVCRRSQCFDGKKWDYEPIPSYRTDAWKRRFRTDLPTALHRAVAEAEKEHAVQVARIEARNAVQP